ncbi:MAG: MBL fold metallo-hydrolase [Acidimicrobiia bacterium]|nr:MBL fold metallo-hydrolase [Acidimicrobiia bacterium]
MKSRQFLPLLLAVAMPCLAAHPSDTISTSQGPLKITPVKHASVMLEFGGKVIHVDPWSQGDYTGLPKADVIFITDVHGDHMDPAKISDLKKEGTVIVAPTAVAQTVSEAVVMANGERKTVAGIQVEAVPMYNLVRGPSAGKFYHDKGRGNGYVLVLGGKRVYFSGDTEGVPEIKALKNIDVAFITMNLPYTMPPEEAAECVKAFRPKIVFPYHYRNSDLKVFTEALKDEKGIEVRLRDWY